MPFLEKLESKPLDLEKLESKPLDFLVPTRWRGNAFSRSHALAWERIFFVTASWAASPQKRTPARPKSVLTKARGNQKKFPRRRVGTRKSSHAGAWEPEKVPTPARGNQKSSHAGAWEPENQLYRTTLWIV